MVAGGNKGSEEVTQRNEEIVTSFAVLLLRLCFRSTLCSVLVCIASVSAFDMIANNVRVIVPSKDVTRSGKLMGH